MNESGRPTVDRSLIWSSDNSFSLAGTVFTVDVYAGYKSTPDRFSIAKTPWMLKQYLELAPEFIGGRVVELGIAQGGSVAFLAHVLQPDNLLAVDIAPERNAALDEFITTNGYTTTVFAEYGVDQADQNHLHALLDRRFGNSPLDLVVDDASHVLDPTLASFTTLFPRLRPGGVFILEDWSHEHTWERISHTRPEDLSPEHAGFFRWPRIGTDLSHLVLLLTLVTGYAPEIVEDVHVHEGFVVIRRGIGSLDPDTFDLSKHYGEVARLLLGETPADSSNH